MRKFKISATGEIKWTCLQISGVEINQITAPVSHKRHSAPLHVRVTRMYHGRVAAIKQSRGSLIGAGVSSD
jgi:hypothetical protein